MVGACCSECCCSCPPCELRTLLSHAGTSASFQMLPGLSACSVAFDSLGYLWLSLRQVGLSQWVVLFLKLGRGREGAGTLLLHILLILPHLRPCFLMQGQSCSGIAYVLPSDLDSQALQAGQQGVVEATQTRQARCRQRYADLCCSSVGCTSQPLAPTTRPSLHSKLTQVSTTTQPATAMRVVTCWMQTSRPATTWHACSATSAHPTSSRVGCLAG